DARVEAGDPRVVEVDLVLRAPPDPELLVGERRARDEALAQEDADLEHAGSLPSPVDLDARLPRRESVDALDLGLRLADRRERLLDRVDDLDPRPLEHDLEASVVLAEAPC